MSVQFGLFEHMTLPPGASVRELFERRIRMVQAAEEAGVSHYFVAEHHGHRLTMAPSQMPWLAAVARETERIRIGTMVSCLPLHEPIRLVEEVVMLDHLSGGRLDFGVGKGISPFEHEAIGHPYDESGARYRELLPVVLRGIRTGVVANPDAHFYPFHELHIEMTALQDPLPIWSPGNPRSAGEQGFGFIAPVPLSEQLRAAYDESWQAGLADPQRLGDPRQPPVAGSSQWLVIAPTDEEATEIALRGIGALNRLMRVSSGPVFPHEAGTPAEPEGREAEMWDPARALASQGAVAGSPETVARYFADLVAQGRTDLLVVNPAFGDLGFAEIERTTSLFFEEVLPAVRASESAAAVA